MELWDCIDISASTGEMSKRYGFISVDRDDKCPLSRSRRYRAVIPSNGGKV